MLLHIGAKDETGVLHRCLAQRCRAYGRRHKRRLVPDGGHVGLIDVERPEADARTGQLEDATCGDDPLAIDRELCNGLVRRRLECVLAEVDGPSLGDRAELVHSRDERSTRGAWENRCAGRFHNRTIILECVAHTRDAPVSSINKYPSVARIRDARVEINVGAPIAELFAARIGVDRNVRIVIPAILARRAVGARRSIGRRISSVHGGLRRGACIECKGPKGNRATRKQKGKTSHPLKLADLTVGSSFRRRSLRNDSSISFEERDNVGGVCIEADTETKTISAKVTHNVLLEKPRV